MGLAGAASAVYDYGMYFFGGLTGTQLESAEYSGEVLRMQMPLSPADWWQDWILRPGPCNAFAGSYDLYYFIFDLL